MNEARSEARLAAFTAIFLGVYAPVETWYSWPELWHPLYLVDLIGIVLLIAGLLTARRTRIHWQPGLLTAGYAWTGANYWRALFGRLIEISGGGELDYGLAELCFIGCILAASIAGLVWSLRAAATGACAPTAAGGTNIRIASTSEPVPDARGQS